MLSPVAALPQTQQTYVQALISRLSQAREYMVAIMEELRQKKYYVRYWSGNHRIQTWVKPVPQQNYFPRGTGAHHVV